ncbi:glycosyltransferase family 4 protein [Nocardioides sp. zg-1308]|uniref:glycosyltransferase n=1 Tax=Nocardioides sp. zg-1308 TaxID=2736253 RepID=UPI00155380D6|nr:glycosyltransferase [Nocardioides sp. zg-1308]NPD03674.1 glycosyltransferase family 4 protein [Nocardioides sp. zg-1308]
MTALRIGFVLEGLALGGCPINALDLARELRAQGHHVVVMAIDEQVRVSVVPYAEQSGFELVRIPAGAGLVGRARHLRRIAREHDLDVLHVFASWLGRSAVLACGLSSRVPVVLNWLMDNEFTTTARTSLVVGTGGLHREAVAVHGSRSYLLEPPVDLARDRPDDEAGRRFRIEHGLGADELVLVLVSRIDALSPEQAAHGVPKLPGILLAMDALLAPGAPAARLVLVGDGSGMEQVAERAAEVNRLLGREAVVLTGALADPHPAYAAADVGLAMGGSALRVMAHGRPLLVLGDRGFSRIFSPETVEQFLADGYYGTVAPADPVANLLAQLDLLRGEGERRRLGAWGRDHVRARHGLEAGADHLAAIYRESLAHEDAWWQRLADLGYLTGRDVLGRLSRRAGPLRALRGATS